MKREGNFWVGANGNKWSCELYTEDLAEEMDKTLVDCRDCTDCEGCTDCSHCCFCTNCSYCVFCNFCTVCRFCNFCTNCARCSHCNHCSHCCRCTDCRGCSYCEGFQGNPQRIVGGRMGRRDDTPSVYWIEEGKEQCVVGCFRGTLEDLEKQVLETHADGTKYRKDYLNFINAVKLYQRSFRK